MSHTPGPWAAYDDWYIRKEGEGSCGSLAVVCKPIAPALSDEDCLSNARLIAAAPDLLAACNNLLDLYVEATGGCRQLDGCSEASMIEMSARAAIAKATGSEAAHGN